MTTSPVTTATATCAPIIVWGIGTSRTLRVHWLAHELQLEYATRPVRPRTGETQTPEYLAMSSKGKVPVLQHGALVVTESAAIIGYLSEAFAPQSGFYIPANASERALLNDWCYSVMTELDAHPLYIMRRHEALAEIYGAVPEAVASAREYFLRMANALSERMDGDKAYLFGDELSIADILLVTTLSWAHSYGLPLSDKFSRYRERACARPAFQTALQLNDSQ